MLKELIFIVYLFNIFTCLSVGVLLLTVKTSPALKMLMYHRAKIFLAVAIIICGLGNGAVLIFGMENDRIDFFSLVSLIVSALQACLFTFLVLILFNSGYVKATNIVKHLAPTFIFLFAYIIVMAINPDVTIYTVEELITNRGNPALLLRVVYSLVYIVQLVVYTRLFLRERKIYLGKIEDYFSDVSKLKLKLGTSLFFQALGVGCSVILFCFYPGQIQDFILTLGITIFYFGFAVSYINYQHILQIAMPAVGLSSEEIVKNVIDSVEEEVLPDNQSLHERLVALLIHEEPVYIKQGLVIKDIACLLKVPKRTLSLHINNTFGMNFNSWINSMRIEHAKKLIDTCPECSLQEIAEQSGFADNAMFSKEFKRHSGESPSVYRKK